MQEVIVNVLFIAVLVVLAGTLFFDVRKKRNRMKTAEREGVELAADLNSKLPEGYVVLKDLLYSHEVGSFAHRLRHRFSPGNLRARVSRALCLYQR